jgi:hypothetical protein
MLGAGRYLLGVAELAILAGFATLGANRVRARLLPAFEGPPAWLATAVVALAILVWVAELLGTVGAFKAFPYLLCVVVVGLGIWALGLRVLSSGAARQSPTRCSGWRDASPGVLWPFPPQPSGAAVRPPTPPAGGALWARRGIERAAETKYHCWRLAQDDGGRRTFGPVSCRRIGGLIGFYAVTADYDVVVVTGV